MEYFRKFLIELRKLENKENQKTKFQTKLIIGAIIGSIIGVVIDVVLPFTFFINTIRGVIAFATALLLYSALYLYSIKIKEVRMKRDKYYVQIRKRFSFNQRLNISILIGTVVVVITILSGQPSAIYTFKAMLSIVIFTTLVAFSRRDRNEFLKSIYEIPDIRDLRFQREQNMQEFKESENKSIKLKKSKKNGKIDIDK